MQRKIVVLLSISMLISIIYCLYIIQFYLPRQKHLILNQANSTTICKHIDLTLGRKIAIEYLKKAKAHNDCNKAKEFFQVKEYLLDKDAMSKLKQLFEEKTSLNGSKYLKNNLIYSTQLNAEIIENEQLKCTIEKFDRKYGSGENLDVETLYKLKFQKTYNYTLYLKAHGFYYISCFNSLDKLIYGDVLNLLPYNMSKLIEEKKPKIKHENQQIKFLNLENNLKVDAKMNVLIIGIDSLSYEHLRRTMPITFDYLTNKLENNIMYSAMNIVAENTFPNLMATLAGINVEETLEKRKYKFNNGFFDKYPFIWNDFEKIGYLTGYQVNKIII